MGTTTPNLSLNKPATSDLVNVTTAINNNMDILDNLAPLASPTFTGTVSMAALTTTGIVTGNKFKIDTGGRMVQNGTSVSTDSLNYLGAGAAHPGSQVSLFGIYENYIAPSTATSKTVGFLAKLQTAAAAFTCAAAWGFTVDTPVIGASSAITEIIGFYTPNLGLAGITNAYGVYSGPQSGAATLNVAGRFDASTTCAIWLGGNTTSTTVAGGIAFGSGRDVAFFRSGSAAASLTGKLSVSGNFGCNGVAAPAQPAQPIKPAATAATNLTPYGYAQAQADAIVTAVNAIIDVLHNNGITA